jgi:tyrosine-protein phosphatase non-receptor type 23
MSSPLIFSPSFHSPSPSPTNRLSLGAVPKKLTQDVDFAPQLRSFIARTYSGPPFTDEIATLNRSRQDALRGSPGSDTTARDLLLQYYGQLELLELRFSDLRVPFPWSVPPPRLTI